MKTHNKLVKRLLLASVLMFVFAFALVPLYDVFCDVTGLNGKPSLQPAEVSTEVVSERLIDVTFLTHIQGDAPFTVEAEPTVITVKPGEMNHVTFTAKNVSEQNRAMQAVPSVSPGLAAQHLHKVECFCFNQQAILAGEQEELTLLFYLDNELPAEIEELTLSYAVFDISGS